jgi:hypothetical protein
MLCRALRSLVYWKGVGRLQTANHTWYTKYAEASTILIYFICLNTGEPLRPNTIYGHGAVQRYNRRDLLLGQQRSRKLGRLLGARTLTMKKEEGRAQELGFNVMGTMLTVILGSYKLKHPETYKVSRGI